MNLQKVFLVVISVLFSVGIQAQEIIRVRKLGVFDSTALQNLEMVNAQVFKPHGYDTVSNPRLPDSLMNVGMLSNQERAEMRERRVRFNPYLTFYDAIALKKGNIFVSFSPSWIRLSSYYKYNTDGSSVAEYRKKTNQNLIGKTMIGYSPNFELLEDVGHDFTALINADTVLIYDTHSRFKYKDTVENYGSMVVNLVKFDLGHVTLRYYYPLRQRKKALAEINKTWGIIRFKPDEAFTHPNREGWLPKPDLYLGKFAFLNDPKQVEEAKAEYELRQQRRKANTLAMEAVRLLPSGEVAQVKRKLGEALALDSNNVLAYRHLLLISLDENRPDDSWKYWNKLHEKDSANRETWFLKGLMQKRYNELDSAAETFEEVVESDSVHFRSLLELASIAILRGNNEAADRHFNRALDVFKTEGEKSMRRESHRMLNINDLFQTRLAYARFLNTNAEFEKSKTLFEQTLKEEEEAAEAAKTRERQRIYGQLNPVNLAELNFMLAMSYAGLGDESATRIYLEKAKSHGKVLPDELESFLNP